jgi:GGDEF domain-containing protein
MGIDPLTGLQDLTALARRFAPEVAPTIAVWVDVDGLIWFNDSEGHEAGDAALAAIGRWLLDACASSGLEGYRVAGDELVLVRPATKAPLSAAEAAAIADRLVTQSPSLGLRFTGARHAANDRDLLTVSALVFLADERLARDRRTVCGELADVIYAAGLAAGLRYQRRGSLLPGAGA